MVKHANNEVSGQATHPRLPMESIAEIGYGVIRFPLVIRKRMISLIFEEISRITGFDSCTLDLATTHVMELGEEQFSKSFNKPFRMFPGDVTKDVVNWVYGLGDFMGGETEINFVSPCEQIINSNLSPESYDVFWRCVRPHRPDVGKAHCDSQFWEIVKGTDKDVQTPINYDERWKVWVPLMGCSLKNGLQMLPGSHEYSAPLTVVETNHGLKPDINSDWLNKHEHNFICPFQTFNDACVLFHDNMIHRAPINLEATLRISAEFTVLLRKDKKKTRNRSE